MKTVSATSTELYKTVTFNNRTVFNADIKPGIGHKMFEFNLKTGELQRVVFKKVKETNIERFKQMLFGDEKPYKDYYFLSALNVQSAIKKVTEKFKPNFVKVID